MTAQEFNDKVVILHKQLYRYAYRYLSSEDDSRDAVQEVYIKLWKMRDHLGKVSSIEAFSIRTMRNHCLDRIKLKKTVSLDLDEFYKNRASDEPRPDRTLELNDSVAMVRRIIGSMPEPQRSVITLRDLEGYSNEEIAEMLQLADGTVRVILSRARGKIRELLLKQYGYENERNRNLVAEVL